MHSFDDASMEPPYGIGRVRQLFDVAGKIRRAVLAWRGRTVGGFCPQQIRRPQNPHGGVVGRPSPGLRITVLLLRDAGELRFFEKRASVLKAPQFDGATVASSIPTCTSKLALKVLYHLTTEGNHRPRVTKGTALALLAHRFNLRWTLWLISRLESPNAVGWMEIVGWSDTMTRSQKLCIYCMQAHSTDGQLMLMVNGVVSVTNLQPVQCRRFSMVKPNKVEIRLKCLRQKPLSRQLSLAHLTSPAVCCCIFCCFLRRRRQRTGRWRKLKCTSKHETDKDLREHEHRRVHGV